MTRHADSTPGTASAGSLRRAALAWACLGAIGAGLCGCSIADIAESLTGGSPRRGWHEQSAGYSAESDGGWREYRRRSYE